MNGIVNDKATQDALAAQGLKVYTVAWEDTGRTYGSAYGSNICDVRVKTDAGLAPMVRTDNMWDLTHKIPVDTFKVVVNEGSTRKVVPLSQYLKDIGMHAPSDDTVIATTQTAVIP